MRSLLLSDRGRFQGPLSIGGRFWRPLTERCRSKAGRPESRRSEAATASVPTVCFALSAQSFVVSCARTDSFCVSLPLYQRCHMEEGKAYEAVDALDIPSQMEELLSAVRSAEENWRFDDRLDLATKLQKRRPS